MLQNLNSIWQNLKLENATFSGVVFFVFWSLITWLAYTLLSYLNEKFVYDKKLQGILSLVLRLLAIGLISIFVIIFFENNVNSILTLLGLFSAALVVALQDFVSSFFAWVFVLAKGKYRVGDVVKIPGIHSYIFGKVIKIEVFRTLLEERVGDNDFNGNLDKESITGRIISIPNNMVIKGALINYSLDNKAIWHIANFNIVLDADFELAEKLLQKIMKKVFNEDFYKNNKIPKHFQPQLMLNISDDGINFTVWFPARIGRFRLVLDQISRAVLIEFRKNKIGLAYKTITIEQKK